MSEEQSQPNCGSRRCSLSAEQVAGILEKLTEAEQDCDEKSKFASIEAFPPNYWQGQATGLFRARCLIREVMDGERELCEHGVEDGEYCQECNAEYKRAAACDGQD